MCMCAVVPAQGHPTSVVQDDTGKETIAFEYDFVDQKPQISGSRGGPKQRELNYGGMDFLGDDEHTWILIE